MTKANPKQTNQPKAKTNRLDLPTLSQEAEILVNQLLGSSALTPEEREGRRKDRKTKGREKVKSGSQVKLDLKRFLLSVVLQAGAGLSLAGEINGYSASCVTGTWTLWEGPCHRVLCPGSVLRQRRGIYSKPPTSQG